MLFFGVMGVTFVKTKGYGEAEGPTTHQWINPVTETTIERSEAVSVKSKFITPKNSM
jgi:hypothetical protein